MRKRTQSKGTRRAAIPGRRGAGRKDAWPDLPPARGEMLAPIGPLEIVVGPKGLEAIVLPGGASRDDVPRNERDPRIARVREQLREYFRGGRRAFDVPLDPAGGEFDRRVWKAVARIPYARTATYAEIARAAGSPGAFRATGAANGRNPIPIVVPCHRVVGSGGRLTGYGGGVGLKARLLRLEGLEFDRDETSADTRVMT